MAIPKIVLPTVCLFAGVTIGAFLLPGPYLYGETRGAHYRVNRFTGVQQYASSKGWVSEREMIGDSMNAFFRGMDGAVNAGSRSGTSVSSDPRGE